MNHLDSSTTVTDIKTKETNTKFHGLYIEPTIMKRIRYYAQAASGEVSGLGTVEKDTEGRYIVREFYLLEQESTHGDTELDPEAISKLMIDMIGRNEDPSRLKFWAHSHGDMGVFWSGTDDQCAETLSPEFAFSLVVNKKRETKCRLDLYNPFRITIDNIRLIELPEEDDKKLIAACEKEVREKVKSPKYLYDYTNQRGYDDGEWTGYDHGHRPFLGYNKKKLDMAEVTADDIERLINIAERNNSAGGVWCWETWEEYIGETLREIVKTKLKPRALCAVPVTWNEKYPDCNNGKCKVGKTCAYWTKVFLETENDALKEFQAMETSQERIDEPQVITV